MLTDARHTLKVGLGVALALLLIVTLKEACAPAPRPLVMLRDSFSKVRHCPVSKKEHPCLEEFIQQQSGTCGDTLLVGRTSVSRSTLDRISDSVMQTDLVNLEHMTRNHFRCVLVSNEFWKTPDPAALLQVLHQLLRMDGVIYIHFERERKHEYVLHLMPRGMHTLLESTGFSTIYIGRDTYVAVKQ